MIVGTLFQRLDGNKSNSLWEPILALNDPLLTKRSNSFMYEWVENVNIIFISSLHVRRTTKFTNTLIEMRRED